MTTVNFTATLLTVILRTYHRAHGQMVSPASRTHLRIKVRGQDQLRGGPSSGSGSLGEKGCPRQAPACNSLPAPFSKAQIPEA